MDRFIGQFYGLGQHRNASLRCSPNLTHVEGIDTLLTMQYLFLFLAMVISACGDASSLVANRSPQAFAGFDQAVAEGSQVTLDGSRSFDPDGNALTYQWQLVAAPDDVELTQSDSAQAIVQAAPGYQGRVTIELTVHDGAVISQPDWVSVNFVAAANLARPTAVAGTNRHLRRGQPLILDGGTSEGVIDTYRWSHLLAPSDERQAIEDGVTALISDLEPGLHVFGLTVGNTTRWSVMDCVSVFIAESDRTDPFPEIRIESNDAGTVVLEVEGPSEPIWSLVSSPRGSSTHLEPQGDNPSRLEYRSETTGLHLFAATLANGLSDWVAVELENTL